MARLSRLVGRGRALEILLVADDLDGPRAEQYGYVHRLSADDRLDAEVEAVASRLARFDHNAIARTKSYVDQVTLPGNSELRPPWNDFLELFRRPATLAQAARLRELGLNTDGEFDNPAEDAEAAAMRTAGLGHWTRPAPWTPRTRPPPSLLVMTLRTDKRRRACTRLGLTRYSQPLPLAGFQTFGDTLRSGRRRIHETTIERQDASAIHRLTPRRSCEDDRDGARTREQAHSARLR